MAQILLKNVHLLWPDLAVAGDPPKSNPTKPGKFGANLVFAPDSDAGKLAQAEFLKVAQAQWKEGYKAIIAEFGKNQKCLRNGNSNLDKEGKPYAAYAGNLYIVAKNKVRPAIIARQFHNGNPVFITPEGLPMQNNQIIDVPFPIKFPYGGCKVNATIDIYSMAKGADGTGVYATLVGVQFFEDGTPIGGTGNSSASAFEDLGDEAPAPAATESATNLFG